MYLIPEPKKMEVTSGTFTVSYLSYICIEVSCSEQIVRQAILFQDALKKLLGYELEIYRGVGKKGDIILKQSNTDKKESYELHIQDDNMTLSGDEKGLWYAMQTILQMVTQVGASIPNMNIMDCPDIENRGYYFDATRGRIPKLGWLKKLADRMAFYKMNQLQLYVEHTYLFRDKPELWRDDTPLTALEIMELDKYCMDRGIELVPCLSAFGHLYKLLSTQTYSHLCELEDSEKQPFSVKGRMNHHTIDVTNPEGIALIKSMISEFMHLFTSKQFNICADETFDLGTGKAKAAADQYGKDRIYINYVKELAEFLVENGRVPMFWGDVILGFPDLIQELPKETICLNWGYAWNQDESGTKRMHDAGAKQYCCPGCCGWNQFVNLNWCSYQNVSRMCTYAKKYQAIGVLNTDWGDFLHMNNPDFSIAGMIYGAAFSWNTEIPDYEEINRKISKVEFLDHSESLLSIITKIPDYSVFGWENACRYMELQLGLKEFTEDHQTCITEYKKSMEKVDAKNAELQKIKQELYLNMVNSDQTKREYVYPYVIAIDGMILFNEIGKFVTSKDYEVEFEHIQNSHMVADQLETWFYHYKKMYRSISKESELYRIQELICFYGDCLRK